MAGPDNQELRSRVSGLLMSSECQSIDFTVDGVHIDGSGLSYVALALVPKKKGAGGLGFTIKQMGANTEAQYDPTGKNLEFPKANYGQSAFERMSIVHECAHALVDARKKKVTWLTNEMCAFITGALYNATTAVPTTLLRSCFIEADKVARTIIGRQQGGASVMLSETDVADLRAAILFDVTYAGLRKTLNASYGETGLALAR